MFHVKHDYSFHVKQPLYPPARKVHNASRSLLSELEGRNLVVHDWRAIVTSYSSKWPQQESDNRAGGNWPTMESPSYCHKNFCPVIPLDETSSTPNPAAGRLNAVGRRQVKLLLGDSAINASKTLRTNNVAPRQSMQTVETPLPVVVDCSVGALLVICDHVHVFIADATTPDSLTTSGETPLTSMGTPAEPFTSMCIGSPGPFVHEGRKVVQNVRVRASVNGRSRPGMTPVAPWNHEVVRSQKPEPSRRTGKSWT